LVYGTGPYDVSLFSHWLHEGGAAVVAYLAAVALCLLIFSHSLMAD
jgi:hypothetical protein